MRWFVAIPALIALAGCSSSGSVHRFGVDYNTAVAGMANEVTLLNVLRAREGHPLHYTSFNRINGAITVTTGGSLNGQLRRPATTATDAGTTTTAPAGLTTARALTEQVVSGGNLYTPQVSGQIVSGPTFEIAVFDTQKFYQGILAPIPFQTIEAYLDQGFDNELLMRLLIVRIDLRLKADGPGGYKKGDLVKTFLNLPSEDEGAEFAREISCWRLEGDRLPGTPRALAPVSRITRGADGAVVPLSMESLALFDGKTFDLSSALSQDPADDDEVMINRVASAARVGRLVARSACNYPLALNASAGTHPTTRQPGELEDEPQPEIAYLGKGKVAISVTVDGEQEVHELETTMQVTFRSTEGVFRFLGDYLRASAADPGATWRLGEDPLFSVVRGDGVLASATLGGERWSLDERHARRNMQVLGLLEQLVNLHKDSAERLATQPVQIVP